MAAEPWEPWFVEWMERTLLRNSKVRSLVRWLRFIEKF
jgi:hypothetical protein